MSVQPKRPTGRRNVNLGLAGSTPTKVHQFRSIDPPISINIEKIMEEACSLKEESIRNEVGERPKTSRGKQHPSPEEFTDYVLPSIPPSSSNQSRSRRQPEILSIGDGASDNSILGEINQIDVVNIDHDPGILVIWWLLGSALRE